jgi:CDP-diacylglycerol---serine O-phosphatidyltransferase
MDYHRRDERLKRRKLLRGEQPISRLFPNIITIAGMCCGLSAVRFAIMGKFEIAVAFILAAAIIDGMDGRVARMLGATSQFGAQLDSLSDFLCFGVAPALVMYLWQLQDFRGIGWAVVLFFVMCTSLRLARFNTSLLEDKKEPWEMQFFTGVPSPAGGILCLLPVIISLQTKDIHALPAWLFPVHVVLIGTLMASRIPTLAGKHMRIKHEYVLPFMLIGVAMLAALVIEPWLSISVLGLVYLAAIPLSALHYNRLKKKHGQASNG